MPYELPYIKTFEEFIQENIFIDVLKIYTLYSSHN